MTYLRRWLHPESAWAMVPMLLALALVVVAMSGCSNLMPKVGAGGKSSSPVLGGTAPVAPVRSSPHRQLVANGTHVLDCVAVLTPDQYPVGLSGGIAHHGAAFAFSPPAAEAFGMKTTATRLVIFWTLKGQVLGQDVMAPDSATAYSPPQPIDEAYELPAMLAPEFNVTTLTLGASCAGA